MCKEKDKAEKTAPKTEKVAPKTEKAEPKKAETKSSGKTAKSAFYYGGKHYKKGDDLSKMKKEDFDFVSKKGKVE